MTIEVDEFFPKIGQIASPVRFYFAIVGWHFINAPTPNLIRVLKGGLQRRFNLNGIVILLNEMELAVESML